MLIVWGPLKKHVEDISDRTNNYYLKKFIEASSLLKKTFVEVVDPGHSNAFIASISEPSKDSEGKNVVPDDLKEP